MLRRRIWQGGQTCTKILGIFEGDGIFLEIYFFEQPWDQSWELYKLLCKILQNGDLGAQPVVISKNFNKGGL